MKTVPRVALLLSMLLTACAQAPAEHARPTSSANRAVAAVRGWRGWVFIRVEKERQNENEKEKEYEQEAA